MPLRRRRVGKQLDQALNVVVIQRAFERRRDHLWLRLERELAADAYLDAGDQVLVQRFRAALHDLDVNAFKQWLLAACALRRKHDGRRSEMGMK